MIQRVQRDIGDDLAWFSNDGLAFFREMPPLEHPARAIFVAIFTLAIGLVGLGFAVYAAIVIIELL